MLLGKLLLRSELLLVRPPRGPLGLLEGKRGIGSLEVLLWPVRRLLPILLLVVLLVLLLLLLVLWWGKLLLWGLLLLWELVLQGSAWLLRNETWLRRGSTPRLLLGLVLLRRLLLRRRRLKLNASLLIWSPRWLDLRRSRLLLSLR